MRVALFLFIAIPLVEMFVLIKVGGVVGALPTIALVCITAAIGVSLIRMQGVAALRSAQAKLQVGDIPAQEVVDGVCLAIAGALLLTPGFVTDTIGFCLLFPPFRVLLLHNAVKKGHFTPFSSSRASSFTRPDQDSADNSKTIEGEYRRED